MRDMVVKINGTHVTLYLAPGVHMLVISIVSIDYSYKDRSLESDIT